MSEWQKIETWDGQDGDEALVWDGFDIYLATFDAIINEWWVLVEFSVRVTHWMPLPSPPNPDKTP